MAVKKILVPTDGSNYARAAVDAAIEVAKATGAEVTALYVVDASAVVAVRGDMYESVTAALNKDGEAAVGAVKDACDEAGVPVRTEIIGGRPADVIVDESGNYDLIVMSTLGKTGVGRFLIGSVAEKVVRMANCKVMTIRSS